MRMMDIERVECGLKISALITEIINICFPQPATWILLLHYVVNETNFEIRSLIFFLSKLMSVQYGNPKLKLHTMLYLMKTHKFLTKGKIHFYSKTYPTCETEIHNIWLFLSNDLNPKL